LDARDNNEDQQRDDTEHVDTDCQVEGVSGMGWEGGEELEREMVEED